MFLSRNFKTFERAKVNNLFGRDEIEVHVSNGSDGKITENDLELDPELQEVIDAAR